MPTHENHSRLGVARFFRGTLGVSVIPLAHDSKRPAVPWKPFQTQKPSDLRLIQWFEVQGYTGIGIVTGAVSRLAVIDFDIPALYEAFREQFPALVQTTTVKTPRGYHLYFRLPERVLLHTRQVPGIDLQVEGRYVVAPPTTVDGHTYHVVEPASALLLSIDAQKRVMAFFDTYMGPRSPSPDKTQEEATERVSVAPGEPLTPEQALGSYYKLAARIGRNNALFQVACLCRDSGWDQTRTEALLCAVHTRQASTTATKRETDAQRYHEAERTIASAYSRPAKPRRTSTSDEPVSHLPNALREKLLALKLTPALRVLEGLALCGVKPGDVVSYSELLERLRPMGVGDWSVRRALDAVLPDGHPLFPPTTPQEAIAADSSTVAPTTNALLSQSKNQRKPQGGRPQRYHRLPSSNALCVRLGIKNRGADPVRRQDVRGVRPYRSRLHRELVARRPGTYTRRWLAERLSVCLQTTRHYDAFQKVRVTPMIQKVRLFWHNLALWAPQNTESAPGGWWLETANGKKYPLKHPIGQQLLKGKATVYVCWREPNHYSVGDAESPPQLPAGYQPVYEQRGLDREALGAYWDGVLNPASGESRPQIVAAVRVTVPPRPRARTRTGAASHRGDKAAPTPGKPVHSDAQVSYWVERVYTWINERAADQPQHRISRATLVGLIEQYGLKLVREGFGVLQWRSNIDNPAGFLVVYCRSSGHKGA